MAQQRANSKLVIWDEVKTTDKDFTQTKPLEGRNVTAINTQYLVLRATEMFGPVGKGWGYEILVDRFDQGAPIFGKDSVVVAHEQVHTCQIKFWYQHGGKRNSLTHYGHTPFVRNGQYGAYTDFDAPKKSLSDAIKKCLSMLGFCADVHMGLFDDQVYLQGIELKKRLDEAGEDEQKEVMREARDEFHEWLNRQLSGLERAPNDRAVDAMKKTIAGSARAKAEVVKLNPSEVERRIDEVAEARKQWLAANPIPPVKPLTKE